MSLLSSYIILLGPGGLLFRFIAFSVYSAAAAAAVEAVAGGAPALG